MAKLRLQHCGSTGRAFHGPWGRGAPAGGAAPRRVAAEHEGAVRVQSERLLHLGERRRLEEREINQIKPKTARSAGMVPLLGMVRCGSGYIQVKNRTYWI